LTGEKQIQDVLGQLVGSLGRMDILVDATPLSWSSKTDPAAAREACLLLAEKMVPFFLAKQRGRIVYLLEDPSLDSLRGGEGVSLGCREVLTSVIDTLAAKYRGQGVTVNALSIGVTDDFILRLHPKTVSLKRSFEDMQKAHPGLKLVELHDVSQSVAYLCSVMSNGLTGQMMRLTHGYHIEAAPAAQVVSSAPEVG
jgi:NAD(P)-dependent dehydrogenase (short-subunit alcohol dehydrogenase family)